MPVRGNGRGRIFKSTRDGGARCSVCQLLPRRGEKFADSGAATPGCWQAVFAVRNVREIARIQFALAGMNAHINHDLPQAVLGMCKATSDPPQHGTVQYNDYTAINTTLDSLVDASKQTLHVGLLGDALPPVGRLENVLAAWDVSAAREAAWNNAELLWNLGGSACRGRHVSRYTRRIDCGGQQGAAGSGSLTGLSSHPSEAWMGHPAPGVGHPAWCCNDAVKST